MIFNVLTAAFMLLGGMSMPANGLRTNVEPTSNFVAVSWQAQQMQMTSATERILIENKAAPYWNLTIEQAWDLYNDNLMTIVEIEADKRYLIYYEGHIEVLLTGGD